MSSTDIHVETHSPHASCSGNEAPERMKICNDILPLVVTSYQLWLISQGDVYLYTHQSTLMAMRSRVTLLFKRDVFTLTHRPYGIVIHVEDLPQC